MEIQTQSVEAVEMIIYSFLIYSPIHANVNRVILEKTVTNKLTNVRSTEETHATEVIA